MTRLSSLLRATIAILALPASLAAQGGSVAGTITGLGSQDPIAAAQITIVGSSQRTVSDDKGHFRFTGLSGSSVTIDVRRIGFRAARATARVGDENVRVSMITNPASLEAVVVTGTAGAQTRRELGNTVSQINAADVVAQAPIPSVTSLINGRAAGVVIIPGTGQIGSGAKIRIRGISSLSLSAEPLLYVDGVRVTNAQGSGPAVQSSFGGGVISRLNDLNPDDIESVEILKGPSAATLYGTEASNGVIQIITKKGRNGAARWNMTLRQGGNYLSNPGQYFPDNFGMVGSTLTKITYDDIEARHGKQFRTGRQQELEVAVNGGVSALDYYLSGNYQDAGGPEPSNNMHHYSGRFNAGLTPMPSMKISLSTGVVSGPTRIPAEGGFGGRVWTIYSMAPQNCTDRYKQCYHSGLPSEYDDLYRMWQDLDRFTGSLRFDHTPVSWFTQRLTVGADLTNTQDHVYQPRIDSLVAHPSFGSDALGASDVVDGQTRYRTADYAANAMWNYSPSIHTTTSVGGQYYRQSFHSLESFGSVFPTPGLSSVSAATQNFSTAESFSEDASLGVYGQEQVAWRDRLFLTAAVRSDQHSAFGKNFKNALFPKFSVSWVISDEDFFKGNGMLNHLSSLRLRSAYGEAGKQPATYASLRTYTSAVGPNGTPAVRPLEIGNPDLGPERGKEIEAGFDAAALNDRIGIEVTYYNKKTADAILNRQVGPSIGFAGTQPFNAGSVRNWGWETLVRGTPYRGDKLGIDMSFSFATNDNKVLDLGGQSFVSGGSFVRHQVGFPVGAWFERRVLSASIDAAGKTSNLMCADTIPGSGGKEGGAAVPCASAPMVYLGRSVPPVEGSFSTTVTAFQRFHVYGMLDFKNGHKKLDGNTRVRCTVNSRCEENFAPQNFQNDAVRIAEIYSSRTYLDFLITKANFARIRELSASYSIPDQLVQRFARAQRAEIAISGRNLKTWTKYTGTDPEGTFFSGSRGGNTSWEQTVLPQSQQFLATLRLTF
ncbi:MAG: hypothetical protein JWO05_57 [Gemmatimonadetes bacterium]|nr:hypothetical protein [Gemmatimonadota bacterium]